MQLANVNDGVFGVVTKTEKFPTSFEVLGMVRSSTKTESFQNYVPELMNRENVPDIPLYLQLYSWSGETHYIDWTRVRKYIPPEPTTTLAPPAPTAPAPTAPLAFTPAPTPSAEISTASVHLHGEKTDVVIGEDVLLKLSAVNIIGNPLMRVQVIIIPPSGWSVTSSEFAKSGAGQYTTTHDIKEGVGRDIEVRIMPNQIGDDFHVQGRIIYYFGDDSDAREDHTLTLPITVRAEAENGQGAERTADTSESEENGASTPGFAAVVAVAGVLAVYLRRRRR
jgi:PGF-CTERM protein